MIAIGDILLITASFALPLVCKQVRQNILLLTAICLVLVAHHVLSITNIYLSPLPGSILDAEEFYKGAVKWYKKATLRDFAIGTDFYRWVLLVNFWVSQTTSKLSGQSLSILAFSAFLVYFVKLLTLLGVRRQLYVVSSVVIAGLVPTVWLFTSLTFREPFQILCLAAASYYFLLFADKRGSKYLYLSWASLLLMGMFHQIMLLYGIFVSMLGLIMLYIRQSHSSLKTLSISLVTLLLIGAAGWIVVTSLPAQYGNNYVRSILNKGSVVEAVVDYRASIEKKAAGSAYDFSVSGENTYIFVVGLARSYANYLLGPTVFEMRGYIDVAPSAATLLRWFTIAICLAGLFTRPGFVYHYLFAIALTLTLLWSIGTTNYGQAFRHNAMTDWIWVLLSTAIVHARMFRTRPNSRRGDTVDLEGSTLRSR